MDSSSLTEKRKIITDYIDFLRRQVTESIQFLSINSRLYESDYLEKLVGSLLITPAERQQIIDSVLGVRIAESTGPTLAEQLAASLAAANGANDYLDGANNVFNNDTTEDAAAYEKKLRDAAICALSNYMLMVAATTALNFLSQTILLETNPITLELRYSQIQTQLAYITKALAGASAMQTWINSYAGSASDIATAIGSTTNDPRVVILNDIATTGLKNAVDTIALAPTKVTQSPYIVTALDSAIQQLSSAATTAATSAH
jgi:hypothetical protein